MNRRTVSLVVALVLLVLSARAQEDVAPPHFPYSFLVDVSVLPTEKSAHVTLTIGEGAAHIRKLTFRIDPARHLLFEGDGRVTTSSPDQLVWEPPLEGGSLRYVFSIDHLRDEASYDARCSSTWALFRGDDLVPPAATVTREGAFSVTQMKLRLPDKWEAVVPYPTDDEGLFVVDNPRRDFDRPTGWLLVGKIGIDEEDVGKMRVTVASPKTRAARRLDTLAMLRWTLPELEKLVPLPDRLTVVGAGDPMWRGGLSGPHSVYVHADRPLIDEDYTSPLLHELLHSVMGARAGDDGDWIVEGLAELYALELLVRSGTVAPEKRAVAIARMAKKAKKAGALSVARADAATTARAVLVLMDLDAELRRRTKDEASLDDVLRALVVEKDEITTARFLAHVNKIGASDYTTFLRGRGVLAARPTPVGGTRPPR